VAIRSVPFWKRAICGPCGLRYCCCLQLSREPCVQTTWHSTLHFLGSSAIHPPVLCPFRACSERGRLLAAFSRTAQHSTLDSAIQQYACQVCRSDELRKLKDIHTYIHTYIQLDAEIISIHLLYDYIIDGFFSLVYNYCIVFEPHIILITAISTNSKVALREL